MKKSLILLIVLLCCAPLVSAQMESFTVESDEAIWAIDIRAPSGSTGTFDLELASGDVVSGTWSYTGYPVSTVTTSIGSSSDSFTFTQPVIPLNVNMQIWNGDNVTKSRQLKIGAGMYPPFWSTVTETTIAAHPITKYTISSSSEITVDHEVITFQEAYTNLHADDNSPGLVTLLEAYSSMIVGIFLSMIYWLKFLFVDHLVLTVLLYMTGTMAYAANTSRNIFVFYKTWFRQQTALFNFIVQAFATTFQIVTQVATVIGNVISSTASLIGSLLLRLI